MHREQAAKGKGGEGGAEKKGRLFIVCGKK
jgi:hypothetical protein